MTKLVSSLVPAGLALSACFPCGGCATTLAPRLLHLQGLGLVGQMRYDWLLHQAQAGKCWKVRGRCPAWADAGSSTQGSGSCLFQGPCAAEARHTGWSPLLAAQAAAETGAGCRLAEDPQQWMDGGTWKGIMHEMIWDEDGEILALRPRPAAWHPPPPRPDYRCVGRP